MLKEILPNLLAGLGLFFVGIKFIGEHMKQMAGRGFRRVVTRLTDHPILSLFSGLIAGGLVQSTSAVTFIMTSLISSRLISVRKAMPVIIWSNVGNSLLVLLAVLDLRMAALYLLGATGFCYYFNLDKSNRFRDVVGTLLGLGLVLLGLILIKTGAAPLKEIEWLTRFFAYTKNSYLLAFFTGGFLTFVAQSSTTVSVIAISLAKVGLLGMDQTIMIIYGSNLGSGISTFFMASNLKGTARQLAIFQTVFKLAGVLVLVPLFYAELYLHLPVVRNLVTYLATDFGRQMAFTYLIFQLSAAAMVSITLAPIMRLLERLSPATEEEELNRTQFIYEQAIEEPETALDLVEKELLRLVRHLPEFLDAVREETSQNVEVSAASLKKAVTGVGAEVTAFVTELIDRHHSRDSLQRALNFQNRTEVIVTIAATLDELVSAVEQSSRSEKLSIFTNQLAEALHLVLTTASDAAENPDLENRQMLLQLTADRGEMMAQIRRSFLAEKSLDPAGQQNLMTITTLFERTIWLLRRFGMLLGETTSTPETVPVK